MRPLPSKAMAVGSWMIGIGQHELEPIAGRQDELLQLLLGRLRQDGRLLREVDAGQILTATAASPALGAALSRRTWRVERPAQVIDRPALPEAARAVPAFAPGPPGPPRRAPRREQTRVAVRWISSSYLPFPQPAAGYHPSANSARRQTRARSVLLPPTPAMFTRHLACSGEPDAESEPT